MRIPVVTIYLLASLALICGIIGCSANPSEPTNAQEITRPGTRFIFSTTDVDSLNDPPTRTSLDTQYYFATGLSVGGNTNVVRYGDRDTSYRVGYFSLDPNGDVESGLGNNDGSVKWIRLPTGSKGTTALPTRDTTYPSGERYRSSGLYTYEETELLTLCGHSYAAIRIRLIMSDSNLGPVDTTSSNSQTYIWWVPKLQFVGKRISEESGTATSGGRRSASHYQSTSVLVQYDPK